MQYKKISLRSPVFLIFVLTLFSGSANYIWLRLNQRPPVDDQAFHLLSALRYLNIMSNHPPTVFPELVDIQKLYPPFFHLAAAVVALIFGKTTLVFIMTNIAFLFGTFLCLYLIGIKMGDRRVGLLASCLLFLYPMFFQLSRMFMLEIALCFMVAAGITALLYSDGFKKENMSVLFGIVSGLGLLTKQYYAVFILGPVTFLLLDSFFYGDTGEKNKIIRNLFLSFALAVITASWWYIPNLKDMLPLAIASVSNPFFAPFDIPLFSFRSLTFYLRVLVNDQILLFFFLVFLCALFILSRKGKNNRYLGLFLVWIIPAYFILTFFKNKFWYYTLSYLPAIALISAYGIISIKRDLLRRISILSILAIGIVHFLCLSYFEHRHIILNVIIDGGTVKDRHGIVSVFLSPKRTLQAGAKYYPQRGDWKMSAIIARILKETPARIPAIATYSIDPNMELRESGSKSIFISTLDSYTAVNFYGLEYYLRLKDIPHRLFMMANYANKKEEIDFIITPVRLGALESQKFFGMKYKLLEEFLMPDRSRVFLYQSGG